MILGIIQARLNSKRLPEKVLYKLGNKTILETIIESCKASKLVDKWLLIIPDDPYNRQLITFANGIDVSTQKEPPILTRWIKDLEFYKNDYTDFVRITADCPLMHPAIIDNCIKKHNGKYTANIEYYPDGLDVQVVNIDYFLNNTEIQDDNNVIKEGYPFHSVKLQSNRRSLRLTLDTIQDYAYLKTIWTNRNNIIEEFINE